MGICEQSIRKSSIRSLGYSAAMILCAVFLLGSFWTRYEGDGISGLLERSNISIILIILFLIFCAWRLGTPGIRGLLDPLDSVLAHYLLRQAGETERSQLPEIFESIEEDLNEAAAVVGKVALGKQWARLANGFIKKENIKGFYLYGNKLTGGAPVLYIVDQDGEDLNVSQSKDLNAKAFLLLREFFPDVPHSESKKQHAYHKYQMKNG